MGGAQKGDVAQPRLCILSAQEGGKSPAQTQHAEKLREIVRLDGRPLIPGGHRGVISEDAADKKAATEIAAYSERIPLKKQAFGEKTSIGLLTQARPTGDRKAGDVERPLCESPTMISTPTAICDREGDFPRGNHRGETHPLSKKTGTGGHAAGMRNEGGKLDLLNPSHIVGIVIQRATVVFASDCRPPLEAALSLGRCWSHR
jgi:hypothetical protein